MADVDYKSLTNKDPNRWKEKLEGLIYIKRKIIQDLTPSALISNEPNWIFIQLKNKENKDFCSIGLKRSK